MLKRIVTTPKPPDFWGTVLAVGWAKRLYPVPIFLNLDDGHAIALPILHFLAYSVNSI